MLVSVSVNAFRKRENIIEIDLSPVKFCRMSKISVISNVIIETVDCALLPINDT